jgi:hypothetical protein
MTQQDFVMVADVPQRARKKQAAVKYALLVAVFIILAVAYYYSLRAILATVLGRILVFILVA